jgi:hypothetical protein
MASEAAGTAALESDPARHGRSDLRRGGSGGDRGGVGAGASGQRASERHEGRRGAPGRRRWSATRPRDRRATTGPAPSGCSAGGSWRWRLPGNSFSSIWRNSLSLNGLVTTGASTR